MNTVNIKLYDLFRKELKLSDEVAKEFVTTIGDEISAVRTELVTKDFLDRRLSDVKTDIVKWMFAFWIGQTVVLAGLFHFLK